MDNKTVLEKSTKQPSKSWVILGEEKIVDSNKRYLDNVETFVKDNNIVSIIHWTIQIEQAIKFDTKDEAQCYCWVYVPEASVIESDE